MQRPVFELLDLSYDDLEVVDVREEVFHGFFEIIKNEGHWLVDQPSEQVAEVERAVEGDPGDLFVQNESGGDHQVPEVERLYSELVERIEVDPCLLEEVDGLGVVFVFPRNPIREKFAEIWKILKYQSLAFFEG